MSQVFVGQLMCVGYNFNNTGFAIAAGQILSISQNTALFSLLGTFYGGDGKSNFALPNLQGNVPIAQGQGPGLSDRVIGEVGGVQSVTLLQSEIPAHSHVLNGVGQHGNQADPSNAALGEATGYNIYAPGSPNVAMSPNAVQVGGSSLPHNNMMQYLTLNWLIALQGVFPSRA
jgi:microcystin-dependent protein